MPFCIVGSYPVFLSIERLQRLNTLALADETAHWRVRSTIANTSENKAADELRYQALRNELKSNPKNFVSEWVEFDIQGSSALENVSDLIFDYCCFRGNAFVRRIDLRSPEEQLSSLLGYDMEDFNFPMGKVFSLNVVAVSPRWSWQRLLTRKNKFVRIIVNVDNVARLVGRLDDFMVVGKDYSLICRKDILVVPSRSIG